MNSSIIGDSRSCRLRTRRERSYCLHQRILMPDPQMTATVIGNELGPNNVLCGVLRAREHSIQVVPKCDDQRRGSYAYQIAWGQRTCDTSIVSQPGGARSQRLNAAQNFIYSVLIALGRSFHE